MSALSGVSGFYPIEGNKRLYCYKIEGLESNPMVFLSSKNPALIMIKNLSFKHLEKQLKSLVANELCAVPRKKKYQSYTNEEVKETIKFLQDFTFLTLAHFINTQIGEDKKSRYTLPDLRSIWSLTPEEGVLVSTPVDGDLGLVKFRHCEVDEFQMKKRKTKILEQFESALELLDRAGAVTRHSNKELRSISLSNYALAAKKVLKLYANDGLVSPVTKLSMGKAVIRACEILNSKAGSR